jgi:hypothetical protein
MTATMPRYVRHWKERYEPGAPLIFLKRLNLGVEGHETVSPGDDVTPAIRKVLGEHRLKVWWNARVIGSKEYAIGIGLIPEPKAAEPVPERIAPVGGGWFEVRLTDGTLKRVRGKEPALKLAAEQQ